MVRASIVYVKQRQQRQQLRRKLGPLEENLVKRITLQRYIDCFNLFTQYLSETRTTWPCTPAAFDLAMSEYLEVLWDEGTPKTDATYSLAALQYYVPQLKKQLPRSWKLKATWDRLELPCQAIPLDLDLLYSFVGYFARSGEDAMALACLLGFNGLLRTGELLKLRVGDCHKVKNTYVLILQETKATARKLLQDESVTIFDPLVIKVIHTLCQGKLPGDFLIGLSPAQFRTKWNHMKNRLELQAFRFLPYSLRRGGATWFFRHTGSFSQTLVRGRWQHLKTCKLYIAEAQTALASLALPLSTQSRLQSLAAWTRPRLARWAS